MHWSIAVTNLYKIHGSAAKACLVVRQSPRGDLHPNCLWLTQKVDSDGPELSGLVLGIRAVDWTVMLPHTGIVPRTACREERPQVCGRQGCE